MRKNLSAVLENAIEFRGLLEQLDEIVGRLMADVKYKSERLTNAKRKFKIFVKGYKNFIKAFQRVVKTSDNEMIYKYIQTLATSYLSDNHIGWALYWRKIARKYKLKEHRKEIENLLAQMIKISHKQTRFLLSLLSR